MPIAPWHEKMIDQNSRAKVDKYRCLEKREQGKPCFLNAWCVSNNCIIEKGYNGGVCA